VDKDSITVSDALYAAKDLIEGDESVAPMLDNVDDDLLGQVIRIITSDPHLSDNQRFNLLTNSWRVSYRVKPPTTEELLTEKWLGPSAGPSEMFPHVKKTLIDFSQPGSSYRHLVLAPHIGWGKSTCATFRAIEVFVNLWCMRNPKKYFPDINTATPIAWLLMSFTEEKAQQVLLQPFVKILTSSPMFHRVKYEERLDSMQAEDPTHICWTTAGRMGSLQFYNDIHAIVGSSPQKLLGLTMIGATLSEISFFVDQGFSVDYIWRTFQDAKWRIKSRFAAQKLAGTILDSSPNDIDLSPIDRYIFTGDAARDPENYVVTGAQWEFLPQKNPIWQRTGETFPVFKGSSKEPAKILRTPDEVSQHNTEDIYNVPIDLKTAFEEDCGRNVKNYCGWPSGSQDKLFSDPSTIEGMFTPLLKNIYSFIEAPANESPERQIWNIVGPKFFIKVGERRWEFYRAPHVFRYIHIDQSESTDFTGISMCHAETWYKVSGSQRIPLTVIVADFTIAIRPGKHRVNLLAIPYFIMDLKRLGGINISKVTFDHYESDIGVKLLKDDDIEVAKQSVDYPIGAYSSFASYINSGRVRVGYNIVLKNNLKSLHEVMTSGGNRKIDHIKGKLVTEDSGTWSTSYVGINAKDVADSLCGAAASCAANQSDHASFIWEEPDDVVPDADPTGEEISPAAYKNAVMSKLRRSVYEKYSMIIK
jgi:hypothetical protein